MLGGYKRSSATGKIPGSDVANTTGTNTYHIGHGATDTFHNMGGGGIGYVTQGDAQRGRREGSH